MILYNVKCAEGHEFEGWFRDSGTYDRQAAAGAIECPSCGATKVTKAPMAPRIGRGFEKTESQRAAQTLMDDAHRKLAELRRHVEETCEPVGDRFAEEARRIHYGEAQSRSIYGEATPTETTDLIEEGVPFVRLPWPREDA
ncbi:MAG: DUF1178 family protein [Inquilinaceae bacterium]